MIRPRSLRPAPAVAALLLLAACSPESAPAPAPAPSSTAVETAAPSPTESSTPTPTPTPEPRKKSQLRKALLTADDLPSGFEKRKALSAKESGITVTGAGSSCPELAELLEADELAGSLVTASVAFGHTDGAGIDQSLEAMPTTVDATTVVDQFAAAASGCSELRLKLRGSGSSPLKVKVLKSPQVGDGSTAVRLTTSGGDLDGFTLTQVVARSDDLVLGMLFAELTTKDVQQIADDAMTKIKKKLDRG